MTQPILLWAVAACLFLVVGALIAIIASLRRKAKRLLKERFRAVQVDALVFADEFTTVRRATVKLGLRVRLERICGYDRTKAAHRATRGSIVFCGTLIVGMLAGLMLQQNLGPVGWASVVPVAILLSRWFYARCDRRYADRLTQQFPDALGTIVRAVRVGIGVGAAIRMVSDQSPAPTSDEFRRLSEEISIGRSVNDALRLIGAANFPPEYRFFATALTLQSQTGGGLTETLEVLADTIRKRMAVKLRGHALAAEARLSCYVLGGLPFAVGAFLFVADHAYVSVLFTTVAGERLLAVAALLLAVGMMLMQFISKRTLR